MRSIKNQLFMGLLVVFWVVSGELHGQSGTLTTTLAGGINNVGAMFDVKALSNIEIDSFDVRFSPTLTGLPTSVQVWALNTPGSHASLANRTSSANWNLLATVPVPSSSTVFPLNLNLAYPILAGSTQAFYITVANSGMRLWDSPGPLSGTLFASNSDLEFYVGHSGTHFNANMGGQVWNGNIHYTALPTLSDDISMLSVDVPAVASVSCFPGGVSEPVSIAVRNMGLNPVPANSLLTLFYQVGNNAPVSEFVFTPNVLNTGDIFSYVFTRRANLSAIGATNLTATVVYGLDLNSSNDMASVQVPSGGRLRVTSYPFIEDFNVTTTGSTSEPPLGFGNESTDSIGPFSDWLFRNDATPSFGTGPLADHSTGISGMGGYAYVEGNGAVAPINLRTPCFDLSGLSNPICRFWVHSDNANGNTNANQLNIDVISYPFGFLTTDVTPSISHLGSAWILHVVDLSPFAGQMIQLVFRGNTSIGGSGHDIAIDDLSVSGLQATPGQAPQPGLAVLDLNNPFNINGNTVDLGFGGPYFTSVAEGGTLLFHIEGTPLQTILLLGGPLNPVVASFPGIGSMDIGGPVDPITGIPSAITVLADGAISFGLDGFFVTAVDGQFDFATSVPSLPPGLRITFQAVIASSAMVSMKLSNAVEVTF